MLARLQQQDYACSRTRAALPQYQQTGQSAGTGQRIGLFVPDLFCQVSFVG